MPTDQEALETLLQKIRDKRRRIATFVSDLEPRGVRLTNLSIICGAVATALTAGPAIGGKTLTDALGGANSNTPSWRILCGVASIFSLIAAVATNLYKSYDTASRLSKAQACDAKLEGIETLVEVGQMLTDEAAKKYDACLADISFIPSEDRPVGRRTSLEAVSSGITSPSSNQIVQKKLSCAGWAKGFGPGLNLWLVVEIDGRIWPKENPIFIEEDGNWRKNIFEEGASGNFSLALFATDAKGNKHIRAWLDACDQLGTYPELRRIPGMVRLDSVNVRLEQ